MKQTTPGPRPRPAVDRMLPLPTADRRAILDLIAAYLPKMNALARQMWAQPELGYQEHQASAAMAALLSEAGFRVTRGVAGLPTAFLAEAGETGPVIGLLAEMDALPGFSQDDSPRRSPLPGQTNGHACGHHLFGAGALGAGVALAGWLRKAGLPGRVRVYGTPAEEGGSGKVFMARAGLFDDLDAVLHWHPDDHNRVWQSRSLASIGARFAFRGRTAHAAQNPHEGRSALHGVEAFHHMAALMREVVPPGTQIHYVVSQGGLATNVIPDRAESQVNIRHPDPVQALAVFDRLAEAARGAAMGTGTTVSVTRQGGVASILPNDVIGRVMYANFATAPAIIWDEGERSYARTLQQSMDAPPPLDGIDQLGPYVFDQQGAFSSDVGDVSWLAPCGAIGSVTWVPGTRPHSWQAVAAGGMSIGFKGMRLAAEGLALSAANLLQSPALLTLARQELETARGPGFAYRPLVGDADPPLDYRAPQA